MAAQHPKNPKLEGVELYCSAIVISRNAAPEGANYDMPLHAVCVFEPTPEALYDHPELAGQKQTDWLKHWYHHSPSGFEIGYMGSGPSDLALCILTKLLDETPKLRRGTGLYDWPDGSVAWSLHHDLKMEMLNFKLENGESRTIEASSVHAWVALKQLLAPFAAQDLQERILADDKG